MNIEDLLGITVVGAGVSLLVEWIKNKFGTNALASKLIAVVASILIGAFYVMLRQTLWWATILTVLTTASTVYALFIPKNN